jgi:hypothetical protein
VSSNLIAHPHNRYRQDKDAHERLKATMELNTALVEDHKVGEEGRRGGGQEGRRAGGQEGRRAGGQEGRRAGGQEGRRAGGQEGRRSKPLQAR